MNGLEQNLVRIKHLLEQETLSQSEVSEICRLSNIGGTVPTADGFDDDGKPFWKRETFTHWAQHVALQFRNAFRSSAGVVDGQACIRSVRGNATPSTWSDEDRGVDAVIASETPVPMLDFLSGQRIDEILLVDGAQYEEPIPVLRDHRQREIGEIVGSAHSARRVNGTLVARLRSGTKPLAVETFDDVREGRLRSVSIGYRILEAVMIMPGDSATVAGRRFTNNGEHWLRVVVRWLLDEVSFVLIPADPTAKVRSAEITQGNIPMVAIHSRNSVSHQPSVRELSCAFAAGRGIDQPTLAVVDATGTILRRTQPEVEWESGYRYRGESFIELMARAAQLDGVRLPLSPCRERTAFLGALHSVYCSTRSMSTSNLAALATNAYATLFIATWDAMGDSTEGWCAEAENVDLRVTERVKLSGMKLTRRPKGKSADHVEWDTDSEDSQVACYSAQSRIDEQDVIDDASDGLLAMAARQFAAAARALRPDLVYSFLARNPQMSDGVALFHTSHGNLLTTAALAEDKLTNAAAAIGAQADGVVALNLRGEYLIVPTKIDRTAAKLAREVDLYDPRAQKPPVVRSDSRLDNGLIDPLTQAIHSGSQTTWYMSTAGRHALEVAYLAGRNKLPQIRMDFLRNCGQFGFSLDVQHFVGVAAVGHQGIVKNTA